MKPLCAIVAVTYNRSDLLKRAIDCINRMHFPLDRLEYVLVDDYSEEDVLKAVSHIDSRIDFKYIRVRKEPGKWQDCAVNINNGIRISTAENIIITHPEVLFGRETVQQFCDRVRYWTYVCAKPYYLTIRDQERLDTVDWINEGPLVVRKIEGFYDREQHVNSLEDYTPWSIEAIGKPGGPHAAWESWVVGGHTRQTWKDMGGHLITHEWGTTDILYLARRRLLGIQNHTLIDDQTLCVHQNHDAPRNMQKTFAEAGTFNLTSENCRYPQVDNLW